MPTTQLRKCLAWILITTLLFSVLSIFTTLHVNAADVLGSQNNPYVLSPSAISPSYISNSQRVSITASMSYTSTPPFSLSLPSSPQYSVNKSANPSDLQIVDPAGRWSLDSDATFTLTLDSSDITTNSYTADIYGLKYTGSSNRGASDQILMRVGTSVAAQYFSFVIPASYFTLSDSGNDSSSTAETYTSDIAIEDVVVTDVSSKEKLSKIDKDSNPFNIEVSFRDYGLEKAYADDMLDKSYSALVTDWGGFRSHGTNIVTLEKRTTSSEGVPRFFLTIPDLTYNGESNQIKVRINYRVDDNTVSNKELTITVVQAVTKEEEEKDEDKISPLKPYIIVSQYNYGEESIIAGSSFPLRFDYKNTSKDIPVDNIVISVEPPADISIATSSNTTYVSSLAANGSGSHSLDLEVKPSAKVGSAELTITFTYQYTDYVSKTRMESTTTEKIAIPITQMDRFSINLDSEIPEATVGEPFTLTLNMINRGQSSTYNISATATADKEISVSEVYFGSLEANKNSSLDIDITCQEPGDLTGQIVLQYEDENTVQKELTVPYTVYVNDVYIPPDTDYPDTNTDVTTPETTMPVISIVFFVIGAVFLAVPLVYYFIKRTKKKESEGFDEDF